MIESSPYTQDKFLFFLYGALVAVSKNTFKPFKISRKELYDLTDIPDIHISTLLNKLKKQDQLNYIYFGDDFYMQIHGPVLKEILEKVNGH